MGPSQHSCAEGARWLIHRLTPQLTHTGSLLLLCAPCCQHHRSLSLLQPLLGVSLYLLPPLLLTPLPQSRFRVLALLAFGVTACCL